MVSLLGLVPMTMAVVCIQEVRPHDRLASRASVNLDSCMMAKKRKSDKTPKDNRGGSYQDIMSKLMLI